MGQKLVEPRGEGQGGLGADGGEVDVLRREGEEM
jgi:hypothetical protein